MATRSITLNFERLARTRVTGCIQASSANRVVNPDGRLEVLPGQGGVVLGVGLGDPAGGWATDHLEPGLSLSHPDPSANRALQVLSCVGNRVVMISGPAAGAEGIVFGKHGAILALFDPDDLKRMAPGEWAAIDAVGVGLYVEEEPDLVCHSCSPDLLDSLLMDRDGEGRLTVPVVTSLPAEAAAAGIGMPSDRFNIDLNVDQPPLSDLAADLRFGDVIALMDHDHRYGRQLNPGWVTIGIIAHGRAVGGGHGFGFVTLLSAPADRIALVPSNEARLDCLLGIEWAGS